MHRHESKIFLHHSVLYCLETVPLVELEACCYAVTSKLRYLPIPAPIAWIISINRHTQLFTYVLGI